MMRHHGAGEERGGGIREKLLGNLSVDTVFGNRRESKLYDVLVEKEISKAKIWYLKFFWVCTSCILFSCWRGEGLLPVPKYNL